MLQVMGSIQEVGTVSTYGDKHAALGVSCVTPSG